MKSNICFREEEDGDRYINQTINLGEVHIYLDVYVDEQGNQEKAILNIFKNKKQEVGICGKYNECLIAISEYLKGQNNE